MKNLVYKGFTGGIEYSTEDNLFYGKIIERRGLISFEGETAQDLENDFKEAIDYYLVDCKANDTTLENTNKGSKGDSI
jgi:predicted HicB family RNase H-like nuclease